MRVEKLFVGFVALVSILLVAPAQAEVARVVQRSSAVNVAVRIVDARLKRHVAVKVDHLILPAGNQLGELPAPEGITVRHDPDDSLSPLDIRRVGTAMSSGGKAFFGVWTDNRIYPFYLDVADGSYFQFSLDTYGGPEVDRNVYLFYRSPDHRTKKPRLQCLVADQEGQVLAHRYVEWTGHELACQLPAQEFSIEKTVEFSVDAYSFGFWQDRAPDEGLYQGL